jgi:hypothetical protein
MSYPVKFEMDYVEQRNRLTTFFRGVMIVPLYLLNIVYGIAFAFVVLIAWFALLFTGRWPEGLYKFAVGYLRFSARFSAYALLATDVYPPFNGDEDPNYPVRLTVDPPLEHYSRLKVFFRYFYVIPAEIIAFFYGLLGFGAALASWFVIVFTGKQSSGLQDAIRRALGYTTKVNALVYLITETYPPASEAQAAPAPS